MDNTGVAGVNENAIRVYPNPASSGATVFVEVTQAEQGATLQLLNAQGRVVLTQQVTTAKTPVQLDALSAGLYLLRITGAKKDYAKSLLVTNN